MQKNKIMEKNKLLITPKTKVLDVIETFPHLEDVLIQFVPAFKKLKNPVLRKTVAKIATLQQAAIVGNVQVDELVNQLRKEVGQDTLDIIETIQYNSEQPEWFNIAKIKKEIDVRPILNAGEQPVNQVISELNQLNENEIYKLMAPFIPAPLIDKSISLGFSHWLVKENDELYIVYFIKKSNH